MFKVQHIDMDKVETKSLTTLISALLGMGMTKQSIKLMLTNELNINLNLEDEICDVLNILEGYCNPYTAMSNKGITVEVPENRVLFLDLDGIINVLRPHTHHEPVYLFEEKQEDVFVKQFARNVDKLCNEFKLNIVVSSSWRYHFNIKELTYLLRYMGITATVVDTTLDTKKLIANSRLENLTRFAEITTWIHKNKHDSYFILDDDVKAFNDTPELNGYLVPSKEGFDNVHYQKCRELLKRKYND